MHGACATPASASIAAAYSHQAGASTTRCSRACLTSRGSRCRRQNRPAATSSISAGSNRNSRARRRRLALTARTVADALRATLPGTARVIACGGGVHNPALMRALADALPDAMVETTAAHGFDPDVVEALGFAWLARQTVLGRPGNLPSVTGATGPRVLGAIHSP
jgi:1,6-anhydro-N-acetylmuramate kinase